VVEVSVNSIGGLVSHLTCSPSIEGNQTNQSYSWAESAYAEITPGTSEEVCILSGAPGAMKNI
jgi:hypothetical protein